MSDYDKHIPGNREVEVPKKKKKKLSHSACAKYMQCPASFDYYYNQGIQPSAKTSALVFGSAIDAGLNALLVEPNKELAMSHATKAFNDILFAKEHDNMTVGKYDYDRELLTADDKLELLSAASKYGYKGDDVDSLVKTLLEKDTLSENQQKVLTLAVRYSLAAKGEAMFRAYATHILPQIKNVVSVQGDAGSGKFDAIVEFVGLGTTLLDHKTSSKAYGDNAVEYSAQLSMYAEATGVHKVAFVVFNKQLQKNRVKICTKCNYDGSNERHKSCPSISTGSRCGGEWLETIRPTATIQVVHGEVTDRMIEVARELQESVSRAVEAKIFPCNVNQCNSMYGKCCEYRDLKWKGSMEGLEKRK
jgi:hypothetical protein